MVSSVPSITRQMEPTTAVSILLKLLDLPSCFNIIVLIKPYLESHTAQKYVPIPAEYIESEISQCIDGTWLTVEWTGQNHSDGYIVVVGDSCTAQRPCSIVKNTVCL